MAWRLMGASSTSPISLSQILEFPYPLCAFTCLRYVDSSLFLEEKHLKVRERKYSYFMSDI
jgi:hypothetical protein